MELVIGLVIWTGIGCVVGQGLASGFLSMRLGKLLVSGLLACVIGGVVCYSLDSNKGVCISCIIAGIFLPVVITYLRLKARMPEHLGRCVVRRRFMKDGSSVRVRESEPQVFGNLKLGWLLVYPQPNGGSVRYTPTGEVIFDDEQVAHG